VCLRGYSERSGSEKWLEVVEMSVLTPSRDGVSESHSANYFSQVNDRSSLHQRKTSLPPDEAVFAGIVRSDGWFLSVHSVHSVYSVVQLGQENHRIHGMHGCTDSNRKISNHRLS